MQTNTDIKGIASIANPTDEQIAEYWRAYLSVIDANRAGYHKPYHNTHDDERLHLAYEAGFHDAVAKVRQGQLLDQIAATDAVLL